MRGGSRSSLFKPLRDPRCDEMCERILAHHSIANGQTLSLPMVDGRRVEFRAKARI